MIMPVSLMQTLGKACSPFDPVASALLLGRCRSTAAPLSIHHIIVGQMLNSF